MCVPDRHADRSRSDNMRLSRQQNQSKRSMRLSGKYDRSGWGQYLHLPQPDNLLERIGMCMPNRHADRSGSDNMRLFRQQNQSKRSMRLPGKYDGPGWGQYMYLPEPDNLLEWIGMCVPDRHANRSQSDNMRLPGRHDRRCADKRMRLCL